MPLNLTGLMDGDASADEPNGQIQDQERSARSLTHTIKTWILSPIQLNQRRVRRFSLKKHGFLWTGSLDAPCQKRRWDSASLLSMDDEYYLDHPQSLITPRYLTLPIFDPLSVEPSPPLMAPPAYLT